MARLFSSKDAKLLIQQHKDRLNRLKQIVDAPRRSEQNVRQLLSGNSLRSAMQEQIRSELSSGSFDSHSPAAVSLISSLWEYSCLQPVSAEATLLLDVFQNEINSHLFALAPAAGNLRWFLTPGRKKQQAEEAFSALSDLSSGLYSIHSGEVIEKADSFSFSEIKNAWSLFLQDRAGYRQILKTIVPDLDEREDAEVILTTVGQHTDLHTQLLTAKGAVEGLRERIKDAADQLILLASIDILKGIPIDQLSREGKGLRVKSLKDSGFETMADAYTAKAYQLSDVHGISDEGALTIKELVAQYALQAKEGAKIRLSADERSPEATRLVEAIFQYRKKLTSLQQSQEYESAYNGKISYSMRKLQNLGCALNWLFYTDEEKQPLCDAWKYLEQQLSGSYGEEVRALIETLSQTVSVTEEEVWADFSQNSISYYNVLEELVPGMLGNDDSMYGLPEDLARSIQGEEIQTSGLNCSLRRYQEWGVKYALHQERVLLGDEMGLGKTVQAIATMVSRRNEGATHFVVVCPASVLPNWCKEISQKSDLPPIKVHGPTRKAAIRTWIEEGGVAVTTFETTGHFLLEDDFKFNMMIVDEAHYIKNPGARRSINVKQLGEHAEQMLFMTGTALENKVDEMLSLLSILQPQIASSARNIAFMSSAPQFRELIAPVYYRRKREDVLTELPELIDNKEWCTLTAEEDALYEDSLYSNNFAAIRRVSWNVDDPQKSSKAKRMLELIQAAKEDGRKVIVFSFFLDTIQKVQSLLGEQCLQPINGSVPVQRRQAIIDEFDAAPAGTVLAAQIQSGGTGLNIQSASVVILCEPQLKPSIENQAISRAYRMGQARNVLVYRLLADNTIDEKIIDLLTQKQAVFDAFADQSVVADESLALDEKTLSALVQEELDRVNAEKQSALPESESKP